MATGKLIGVGAVAIAIAIAGCGGSSSSSTSSAPAVASTTSASSSAAPASSAAAAAASKVKSAVGSVQHLAADPGGALKFNTSALHASAGKVTIAFTNKAPLPHNLTIAGPGGAVVGATPTFQGGSKVLNVSLKPGTYTFYCSVPGHRAAGMQGTLTVT